MEWNWTFIHTEKTYPFVTSDWPVFMEKPDKIHFVSFPISSETSLIICDHSLPIGRNPVDEVCVVNRQTCAKAQEFVICHQNSFPGDDLLSRWVGNT